MRNQVPSNLEVSFGDFLFSQRKNPKVLKVISFILRNPSQISCLFFLLVFISKRWRGQMCTLGQKMPLAESITRAGISLSIQNLVLPSTTSSEFHKLFLKTFMAGFPCLTTFFVILPARACHAGK